jgi:ribose 5-phosphate isomerase A
MQAGEPTKAAERALEFVRDETVIGLGSGRAATNFVQALGERVRAGLRVRGVPTSEATAEVARRVEIPLATLDQVDQIDLTVDGADEVDPQLDLIKGYGGALVREKVVAAASTRLIILVGREKLVPILGTRGRLPVEVVPFGEFLCRRRLMELGCRPTRRLVAGKTFTTDNGNHILDCAIEAMASPEEFERRILAIPGVVGTGLFLGMADVVLVEDSGAVEIRQRGLV